MWLSAGVQGGQRGRGVQITSSEADDGLGRVAAAGPSCGTQVGRDMQQLVGHTQGGQLRTGPHHEEGACTRRQLRGAGSFGCSHAQPCQACTVPASPAASKMISVPSGVATSAATFVSRVVDQLLLLEVDGHHLGVQRLLHAVLAPDVDAAAGAGRGRWKVKRSGRSERLLHAAAAADSDAAGRAGGGGAS